MEISANAQIAIESDSDLMSGKFLTFVVEGKDYGIEICHITEIIEFQAITHVPHTPEYLRGITNLRGTITPIIDLQMRFGGAETVQTARTCIIVLQFDDASIGVIVDEVHDVIIIPDEMIQPPPAPTGMAQSSFFVRALGQTAQGVVQILDIEKVFDT